jgi:hypothetical protein
MPRFIEPPPTSFDEQGIVNWLGSVYQAVNLLENLIVTTTSAAMTLTPEHSGLICVANTGAIAITLPKAATAGAGLIYMFVKTTTDAEIITIDGNGSETINGATTYTSMDAQYDRVGIVSDGDEWFIYEEGIS